MVSAQETAGRIGDLPAEVSETSGLLFYNNKLLTHNDSGKTPQVFEIDTANLSISRTVTISNATNVDWEDITQDSQYIYIGDFGNIRGDRTDLVVYRVAKAEYLQGDAVPAERIEFSYEDQTDLTPSQRSDWDAEALVAIGDQLVIFTKPWQTSTTRAYAIPKVPGKYAARNLGSYSVNGLITGATFTESTATVFLLGYTQQLQPFVVEVGNIGSEFAFNGSEKKTFLSIGYAQVEGITSVGPNRYFISSEYFNNANPPVILQTSLFFFTLEDDEEPGGEEPGGEEPGGEEPGGEEPGKELVLFRSYGSNLLEYELNLPNEVFGRALFDTSGRMVRYAHADEIEGNSIDLQGLRTSVYYLTFYLQGRTLSRPFVSN